MGTCGALEAALKAGDVVVYESCRSVEGARLMCDAPLSGWAATVLKARLVHGVTAVAIVQTAAGKHRLGAQSGAAAVDLESAPLIEVARARGVRVTIVRAVSDTSETDLPDLQSAVDARGNLAPLRVARALLRAPRASLRLAVSGPRALWALAAAAAALAAS